MLVSFGTQNVDSRRCIGARVVTGVSLVLRIQGIGFDGGGHDNDGCPKGLVQDDDIIKCSHCCDIKDQRLDVEL